MHIVVIKAPKICLEAWRKHWFGFEKMWYLMTLLYNAFGNLANPLVQKYWQFSA